MPVIATMTPAFRVAVSRWAEAVSIETEAERRREQAERDMLAIWREEPVADRAVLLLAAKAD